MAVLISIPIFTLLLIFQTAVVSRIELLHGTADLVLLAVIAWALQKRVQTAWHWGIIAGLLVSLLSGLPMGVPLVGYLVVVGIALILRQRLWQVPILAMFVTTFLGTLLSQAINLVALRLFGTSLPWLEAINQITLPSVLLNLLLAIPFFALLGDLANWLYPEELEV
ncbi:MAG TPA: rod shape-determining protein MreD [Anaerolineales bacterium]